MYEAIKVRGTKKGKAYAIKQIKSTDKTSVTREIIVQERVGSSKCIPKYHFKYTTEEYTYLFFDFIKGGSLFDYLEDNGHFPHEDDVKPYLQRIITGIEDLHMNRIIHRDIKLENIVLSEDGKPYIIDFGCAKIFEEDDIESARGKNGTIMYSSPEMLRGEMYSYETDWWSLGVCVFEMMLGEEPFSDDEASDETIKHRILTEEISWSKFENLSEDAIDFLNRLLCKDPRKRLGRNGAEEVWNHPFMAS